MTQAQRLNEVKYELQDNECKRWKQMHWLVVVCISKIILIGAAVLCVAKGDLLEAIAVFILIEIREMNLKMKDS